MWEKTAQGWKQLHQQQHLWGTSGKHLWAFLILALIKSRKQDNTGVDAPKRNGSLVYDIDMKEKAGILLGRFQSVLTREGELLIHSSDLS